MIPCVILAGGLGTRIRPLVGDVPKAMVRVAGRPFISLQLDLLRAGGVQEVVICVGYGADAIERHVGDGRAHGVAVTYSHDGPQLLGTGGALRRAADSGALDDERFLVVYGDSYTPIDFEAVDDAHLRSGRAALMVVIRNAGRWDASNAEYRTGLVSYDKTRQSFDSPPSWIDYGVSVITRRTLLDRVPARRPFDLADLLGGLSRQHELAGYAVTDRFYEVGTPDGLADLERHLLSLGDVGRGQDPGNSVEE